MVGSWFTTPWQLVSQSHGALAQRFLPPIIPCFATPRRPIPLCHIPSPITAYHPRSMLSRSPGAVVRHRPHSLSGPVPFLHPPSRVYTPLGRQQPCGAGPLDPHPSGDRFVRLARVASFAPPLVWLVCFLLVLLGALLRGSPPLPTVPVPIPHLVTCIFFFSPVLPAAPHLQCLPSPYPRCLLALCCAPSGGALWFCFFLVCPPPFPLWVLPCGFLSLPLLFVFFSSSLHARTSALHWSSGHGSPRCSSAVPLPSRGVPLGVHRPSQVGAPPLHHSHFFPLFSPPPPLQLSLARPLTAPLLLRVLSAALTYDFMRHKKNGRKNQK